MKTLQNAHVASGTIATVFNSATTYVEGQIVSYHGALFQCVLSGTGKRPHMEPSYWAAFGSLENVGRWLLVDMAGVVPTSVNSGWGGNTATATAASTRFDLFSSAGVTITGCSTTAGSMVVMTALTTGAVTGQMVSGTGIPTGATITAVAAGVSITISRNALSTNASMSLKCQSICRQRWQAGIGAPALVGSTVYRGVNWSKPWFVESTFGAFRSGGSGAAGKLIFAFGKDMNDPYGTTPTPSVLLELIWPTGGGTAITGSLICVKPATNWNSVYAGASAGTVLGSTNVTCASTTGLVAGQLVSSNTGSIPPGATVASITNSTTFVISEAATATSNGIYIFASIATTTAITFSPALLAQTGNSHRWRIAGDGLGNISLLLDGSRIATSSTGPNLDVGNTNGTTLGYEFLNETSTQFYAVHDGQPRFIYAFGTT